jgi:hypothetical protein
MILHSEKFLIQKLLGTQLSHGAVAVTPANLHG